MASSLQVFVFLLTFSCIAAQGEGGSGGAVYARWGRKQCPSTSTKLYNGVMGGDWFNDLGGASNYICLPLNPIYERFVEGAQHSSFIHGTEYQLGGAHGWQHGILPNHLHDQNVPCAVCHAESRGSHLMIPARNVCPGGWNMEYKGYLMSAHYLHRGRTEYVCVDGKAEGTIGSHRNEDGALLFFVEGHCGQSLPCPPYVHGKELTCVVCTK